MRLVNPRSPFLENLMTMVPSKPTVAPLGLVEDRYAFSMI
jgi:hypothetical protein